MGKLIIILFAVAFVLTIVCIILKEKYKNNPYIDLILLGIEMVVMLIAFGFAMEYVRQIMH